MNWAVSFVLKYSKNISRHFLDFLINGKAFKSPQWSISSFSECLKTYTQYHTSKTKNTHFSWAVFLPQKFFGRAYVCLVSKASGYVEKKFWNLWLFCFSPVSRSFNRKLFKTFFLFYMGVICVFALILAKHFSKTSSFLMRISFSCFKLLFCSSVLGFNPTAKAKAVLD